MAYVDEEIPEEQIMMFLDFLLYIVLDPQDQPNTNLLATPTADAMVGKTCIIQEKIPLADRPVEPPPPTSAMA